MSSSLTPKRSWLWQRLWFGYRKIRQHPEWESWAGTGWADRIMTEEVTDRFHAKQGRTIARWALNAPAGPAVVYLKRHYRLPRLGGLLAALLPGRTWSPGLEEFEHLEWAAKLGLPVPRAMAAGELVGAGGRLQSFLAVEELTGMLALHEAIPLAQRNLDSRTFQRWKRTLAAEMARLTLLLHQRSVFHKDLYLCHFFIPEADCKQSPARWAGRVHVIDLHRLARHPATWLWWQVKDLAQLLYSSETPGVTIRDRIAFWRAYRAGMGKDCRLLKRFARLKWRMYRRHNEKRKARRTNPR